MAKVRSFAARKRSPAASCSAWLLKSAPAQKLLPLPVMITQRRSSSERARETASRSPSSTSFVMLFRFSGRFSVILAIC
jgi:hypothetical protein